jgi:hypothetical protein
LHVRSIFESQVLSSFIGKENLKMVFYCHDSRH